jgi:hypothetical protein
MRQSYLLSIAAVVTAFIYHSSLFAQTTPQPTARTTKPVKRFHHFRN